MSNATEGKKKTVKVNGKDYTLQHPGIRWFIKHSDSSKDTQGNFSNEKYIDGLLENVVIQQVTMEDFDSISALRELVDEIETFLGA
ncbi:hypothetical protein [Orenia marismortui]|uniref:Tail assembly chaperone n=1 Tax=Orenia marismortui TaxID=46469 RepID=A0A4R8GNT2_9FIRM|nr:hypothetical protein [Orenia marismortui]TDX43703.1 hypothetical protein C7959_1596 [Orenia marismortui]